MRDEPRYKKLHSERLNDEIVASRTRMYDRTAPKRIEIYKKCAPSHGGAMKTTT